MWTLTVRAQTKPLIGPPMTGMALMPARRMVRRPSGLLYRRGPGCGSGAVCGGRRVEDARHEPCRTRLGWPRLGLREWCSASQPHIPAPELPVRQQGAAADRDTGRLSAPETVQTEVLRKSRADERFRAAATTWQKLTPNWIDIFSDDETPELAAVVHRITRQPMSERLMQPKDRGEIMVVAHAVVTAESGHAVTVLIDDGRGDIDDGLPPLETTNLLAASLWS